MAGDIQAVIHMHTHSQAVNRFHSVASILFWPWLISASLPGSRGRHSWRWKLASSKISQCHACVPLSTLHVSSQSSYRTTAKVKLPKKQHYCCVVVPSQRLLCVLHCGVTRPTSSALNEAVRVIASPRLRLTLLSHQPQLRCPLKQEER